MKKLKLLPSILMLVLCVGVLAVGVFAITPTTNTISGQITINAINAGMEITPYKLTLDKDGNETAREALVEKPIVSRQGIDIPLGNLSFNTENANVASDVADIVIALSVKNTSSEALGMYFSTSTTPTPDDTTESIKLSAVTTGETPTTIPEMVEASFSGYNYLPAGGTNELTLTFSLLKNHTEQASITLDTSNISLNITNLNTDLLTDGWRTWSGSSSTWVGASNEGVAMGFEELDENMKSVKNVIFAEGVTYIPMHTFSKLPNLEYVILPESLTRVDSPNFDGWENGRRSFLNEDPNCPGAYYLGTKTNPYFYLVGIDASKFEKISENTKWLGELSLVDVESSLVIPNGLVGSISYGVLGHQKIGFALTFASGIYTSDFNISSMMSVEYENESIMGWFDNPNGTGDFVTKHQAGEYLLPKTYYFCRKAS